MWLIRKKGGATRVTMTIMASSQTLVFVWTHITMCIFNKCIVAVFTDYRWSCEPHRKLLAMIKGKAVGSVLLTPAAPLVGVTHHSAVISMSTKARVYVQSQFLRTRPNVDGKTADMEENIKCTLNESHWVSDRVCDGVSLETPPTHTLFIIRVSE